MAPRTMRSRLLDLAVTTVCVACVAAPLLPIVHAASSNDRSVVESTATVDQRVAQHGTISDPLDGSFSDSSNGIANGAVSWEIYSTSAEGMKLVLSSDRSPALRDARNGIDVPDYTSSIGDWSVGSGDRRFGFSVLGDMSLEKRYDQGRNWRGFDGKRSVEVARRAGAFGATRTTVKLRAEYGSALPADARATANIRMTGVLNL